MAVTVVGFGNSEPAEHTMGKQAAETPGRMDRASWLPGQIVAAFEVEVAAYTPGPHSPQPDLKAQPDWDPKPRNWPGAG